jgi:hypothetical protein
VFLNPLALCGTQEPQGLCQCSAGGRQGEHAARVVIRTSCAADGVGSYNSAGSIDLCLFHSPPLPSLCGSFVLLPLARCCHPQTGCNSPYHIRIPRMSILVISLRQPAVLPTALPSPWGTACSYEVGLRRTAARIAPLPFAGRHRQAPRQGTAAARSRGGLDPRKRLKHGPHPAVFVSLHSAAALEAQVGRGETPRASREKERSQSAAPV